MPQPVKALYGSLDTSAEVHIEMPEAGVPSSEAGPGLATVRNTDYVRRSRFLTVYQVLLVLATMAAYTRLFEHMGWLRTIDDLAQAQQLQGTVSRHHHNAPSLPETFDVDKRGLTSYPDMVFFQFEDHSLKWFGRETAGHWVWTHGILYLATGPALLHAVSGGLLDPVWYTVMKDPPDEGSECLKLDGDRHKCALELLKDEVNLEKMVPSDGFFAFVQPITMDLWKLKLDSRVGESLTLKTHSLQDEARPCFMLVYLDILCWVLAATTFTQWCIRYMEKLQHDFLRTYISRGLFLHDESQHYLYDQIAAEEVHECEDEDDHLLQHQVVPNAWNIDSDDEDSNRTVGKSKHANARRKQERFERRLAEVIGKEQGFLHYISNTINGAVPRAPVSMNGLGIEVLAPTISEQLVQRTQTTAAHMAVVAVSTLPVMLMRVFFLSGIEKFGGITLHQQFGAAPGTFHLVLVMMFQMSFVLLNILMGSLVLHYVFESLDNHRMLAQSPFLRWLFVKWSFFKYIQVACFWISSMVICQFIVNGCLGLLLHFFTNMFAVTAVVGTWAAVYTNFRSFAKVVKTVHGEIEHASAIMDFLKDGLSRRIIELATVEKKLKKELHQSLAQQEGQSHEAAGVEDDDCLDSIEAWEILRQSQSNAVDLSPATIYHLQRYNTARRSDFGDEFEALFPSGGTVDRRTLEDHFGKLTEEEWDAFDANHDGAVSLQEWQEAKMMRVQKGVLLIRSSFEHCVEAELSKQGYSKATVICMTLKALAVTLLVLATVYYLMESANAFGAISAMVSSGMSALAIGFLNMPNKKKKNKMDPNLEQAIKQLNKALQKTVASAVADLVAMLRFFPRLLKIMKKSIDLAETHLDEINCHKPEELQKNAAEMIDVARKAYKTQLEAQQLQKTQPTGE